MNIANDLRAAADKLHEARAGGDEVAIQCVEQLRRHADTIERVEQALRMAVRQNEHDMLMTGEELRQCHDALRGDKP